MKILNDMTNIDRILIAVGTIATAAFIAHLIKSSLSLKTNEHVTNNYGKGKNALPLQ